MVCIACVQMLVTVSLDGGPVVVEVLGAEFLRVFTRVCKLAVVRLLAAVPSQRLES